MSKRKPTKLDFYSAYRTLLTQSFEWAKDARRLDSYMVVVADTLEGKPNPTKWIWNGSLTKRAFNSIGVRGKPTLDRLRGLA